MPFRTFSPARQTATLITTAPLAQQVWRELVLLRHTGATHNIKTPDEIAPWIDQAKTYFLDAIKSDWRSAGLLYYYSFLNISKALLVAKGILDYQTLHTTAIYHGLSASSQAITDLTTFEISIFPSTFRNKQNIFAHLYQAVTNHNWPHNAELTIPLSDFSPYCVDITTEQSQLFSILPRVTTVESLVRGTQKEVWLDMIVPIVNADEIIRQVKGYPLHRVQALNDFDLHDYLLAYDRKVNHFTSYTCVRGPSTNITPPQTQIDAFNAVQTEAVKQLARFAVPPVQESSDSNPDWLFVPDITLHGISMPWHPLLSDYLLAFALSTILRYQPQLLVDGSKNQFLSEAWCSQSPISCLRYFLMLLTQPSLRITANA
ncbi:MAG: YaaC family protein [Gammaproteobacteria bacterium]